MKKFMIFLFIFSMLTTSYCVEANKTHVHTCLDNTVHFCDSEISKNETPFSVDVIAPIIKHDVISYSVLRETEEDIPEEYEFVVIEPKNRIQEARRIVEEDTKTNICSKNH